MGKNQSFAAGVLMVLGATLAWSLAGLFVRHVPGLTGWAQINGRDELPIPEKVKLDAQYLKRQSFIFDMWVLWLTFLKVLRRDGVAH